MLRAAADADAMLPPLRFITLFFAAVIFFFRRLLFRFSYVCYAMRTDMSLIAVFTPLRYFFSTID